MNLRMPWVYACLLLSACGTDKPLSSTTPNSLIHTKWSLQKIAEATGVNNTPSNLGEYSIEFISDREVIGQSDCNAISGTYSLDRGKLTIKMNRTTKALCNRSSYDGTFAQDLSLVVSYTTTGAALILEQSHHGKLIFEKYFEGCGDNAITVTSPTEAGSRASITVAENASVQRVIEDLELTFPEFELRNLNNCSDNNFNAVMSHQTLEKLRCRADIASISFAE